MSSRFHNKYHRHNHHSRAVNDPRYPDASHDPIASVDVPFKGPFYLWGTLSATALDPFGLSEPVPAGIFYSDATAILATTSLTGLAIQTQGDVSVEGDLTVTGTVTAQEFHFTGNVISTFNDPLTATGDFLEINIGGQTKAIRLWNF